MTKKSFLEDFSILIFIILFVCILHDFPKG